MATDCDGVAVDERCSDGGSATDEPITPIEPLTPTEPLTPIELACDEDGNLVGTGPFEVVVSGDDLSALAIAPDGTVFAAGTIDGFPQQAFRVVDGEPEPFGEQLWNVERMLIDGSDLIVAAAKAVPTLLATDLESERRRILSRSIGWIGAIAVDDEAIYWFSVRDAFELDGTQRHQLWRSPRESGESVLTAELDGTSHGDLIALNDALFFLRDAEGTVELARIAKPVGSAGASATVQVFPYANSLRTDGEDLFLFSSKISGVVLDELHVVRVDGVTLEAETMFEPGAHWGRDLIVGDGLYMYWTTYNSVEDNLELWRGLSDGSDTPRQLGTFEASTDGFTRHDDELYWISSCPNESEGAQRSHIVKLTD